MNNQHDPLPASNFLRDVSRLISRDGHRDIAEFELAQQYAAEQFNYWVGQYPRKLIAPRVMDVAAAYVKGLLQKGLEKFKPGYEHFSAPLEVRIARLAYNEQGF